MSFQARYPGKECILCEETIVVGQEVEFNDDRDLMHVLCPSSTTIDINDPYRKRRPLPVCPRCFLEMTPTGVCGNCDD